MYNAAFKQHSVKDMNIKKAKEIIDKVKDVVSNWTEYAKDCIIPKSQIDSISSNHKIDI